MQNLGGGNNCEQGAKIVKSPNKIHKERGEFCKRLINMEVGIFARRETKCEKNKQDLLFISEMRVEVGCTVYTAHWCKLRSFK